MKILKYIAILFFCILLYYLAGVIIVFILNIISLFYIKINGFYFNQKTLLIILKFSLIMGILNFCFIIYGKYFDKKSKGKKSE